MREGGFPDREGWGAPMGFAQRGEGRRGPPSKKRAAPRGERPVPFYFAWRLFPRTSSRNEAVADIFVSRRRIALLERAQAHLAAARAGAFVRRIRVAQIAELGATAHRTGAVGNTCRRHALESRIAHIDRLTRITERSRVARDVRRTHVAIDDPVAALPVVA